MAKIFGSVNRYIQQANILENIDDYLPNDNKKILIITNTSCHKRFAHLIKLSTWHEYMLVDGECSINNINKIVQYVNNDQIDILIALGGGKIIDITKAVAHYANAQLIIVPTIASNDSPCSSLAVIYNDDHTFDKYLYLDRSPDLVIVDTDIIAKAPIKFFKSGIKDALATYYEAIANHKFHKCNELNGHATIAALSLAKASHRTILKDAEKALISLEKQKIDQHVDDVIEAIILLSGIGFESGGLFLAHSLANNFNKICDTKLLHGDIVAITLLIQLKLFKHKDYPKILTLYRRLNFLESLDDFVLTDEQYLEWIDLIWNKHHYIKENFEKKDLLLVIKHVVKEVIR